MKWLSQLFRAGRARRDAAPDDSPQPHAPEGASHPAPTAGKKEINLRQGAPEFDHFIATGTLALGEDLAHGAEHLAELLKVDPAHAEWRALIGRYVEAAAGDIEALLADKEPRHAATEALRAYLWHGQGRTGEAVDLLVEVSRALGDARYLHAWVLEWLEPEGAVEALPERAGQMLFGTVMTLTPGVPAATARTVKQLRCWLSLFQRVSLRYAEGGLPMMIHTGLLRRVGMDDEALAVAGPVDQAREFSHAAAIGLALRSKGQFEASAQAFAKALELEPGNISGHLEAGDSYLAAQAWQKALGQYESALALEPDQAWAEASALYCRWKLGADDALMQQLQALMNAGNDRAHALVFREYGAIAESGDATANILRQMRKAWSEAAPQQENAGGQVKLTLSTMESPSNHLACALLMSAFRQNAELKISVGSMPAIDPRVPIAEVKYLLWRFDGVEPRPALPPPSPEVSARIAALAAEPYDPEVNWAQASHVALALGPQRVAEVLAVMVHPPAMPAGTHELAWLPRVQWAAAQVAGQVDEGWEGSLRREALLSVLYGPRDWVTTAAIRVLAHIARQEPAHAVDIHHAFEHLEKFVPADGHWDWIEVLYAEWQKLPYLFDREREQLRQKRAALSD